MTIPKAKSISVSKGLMALADVKLNSPMQTNSQNVIVNVHERDKPYEDEDGIVIVPTEKKEDVNVEYKTRDLSSVADIRNDYEQLRALLTTQEKISQALSIMLNLVEHNPLIINKYVVCPKDILENLLTLLCEADKVNIHTLDPNIGCICDVKFIPIDKIFIEKYNQTFNLKYSFPDVIKIFDEHKISLKVLC